MQPPDLLEEYVRRHNDGVRTGSFAALAELFEEGAEVTFEGVAGGPFRGRSEILRGFTDRPPEDSLVAGPCTASGALGAAMRYSWSRAPLVVAGTLRSRADWWDVPKIRTLRILAGSCDLAEQRPRRAARVLVIDDEDRLLLLRCVEPRSGDHWWITPGGGIDPGEDELQATRRELVEEIGLDVPAGRVGPPVWTRTFTMEWGGSVVRQTDAIRVVRVPSGFVPRPSIDDAALAREGLVEHRWWSAEDLLAAASSEIFAPRRLPLHFSALLRSPPPPGTVLDVGV